MFFFHENDPEFPCLYDKQTPECHLRDVAGNCWKEVANKAGLENGKIPFLLFQTFFLIIKRQKPFTLWFYI